MSWILTCVIVAFILYLVYNGVALGLFGVPKSLSMTFYLFQEKKKWTRIFFPIMMISVAFLLLPAWLEISALSSLQFLAFLAAAGLIFVGAAPAFESSDLENAVHMTSAIVTIIFAILWVVLVSKLWWVILVWLAIISLIILVTKTVKSSYIYWLETMAVMSTFTSILVYYLA